MRSAASLVRYARALNGLSQRELARAAEVAPSTLSRIESGRLDPTWTLLGSVLEAAGYRSSESLLPTGDETAITAAVAAMSSGSQILDNVWTERWRRAGLIDAFGRARDFGRVALQAGLTTGIDSRAGVRRFIYDRPWQALADAFTSAGIQYAFTGPLAFGDEDTFFPTAYAQSTDNLDLQSADGSGRALVVLPLTDEVSIQEVGLYHFVSAERALVDCYAGNGRVPDQADGFAGRLQNAARLQDAAA